MVWIQLLWCYDTTKDFLTLSNKSFFTEIARIGEGKKIFQLEYISEEHLLVVVSGKQRHVRLVPIRALDGDDTEWIKVSESKGCSVLTVGAVLRAPLTFCLCIAVKKQQNSSVIIIYEVTRTRTRHHRLREINFPQIVHSLQLLSDGRLCVGSPSCFSVYNLQAEQAPMCKYFQLLFLFVSNQN